MKYYVVSESDLLRLAGSAHSRGFECGQGLGLTDEVTEYWTKAEAACRARPFTREMYAEICAKVDREQKNGDFSGSFFEGVCKYLFDEGKL